VLLDYFAEMSIATDKNLRIYAPEAFTPFAARLRQDYSEFFGSEYMPDAAVRERYAPVQHEDLEALSFSDGSFDVVFCNELFEHLPDLPRCLREVHRVLSPGGTLLATFPFAYGQQETVVRAIRENGTVQIIGEAEYHVDPVDLEGGALVFQIPGWEILDTLRNIGFSLAEFRFVSSSKRGICTADLAGALFLRAVR
jgi:SAM-dependent methyltransferase